MTTVLRVTAPSHPCRPGWGRLPTLGAEPPAPPTHLRNAVGNPSPQKPPSLPPNHVSPRPNGNNASRHGTCSSGRDEHGHAHMTRPGQAQKPVVTASGVHRGETGNGAKGGPQSAGGKLREGGPGGGAAARDRRVPTGMSVTLFSFPKPSDAKVVVASVRRTPYTRPARSATDDRNHAALPVLRSGRIGERYRGSNGPRCR